MASLITLAQLRMQSQQRADMENAQLLSNPEWNTNINKSAARLYNILTTVFEEYYVKNSILSLTPSTATYPLPVDFYKLIRIDEIVSGSATLNVTTGLYELNGQAVTVKPYNEQEKNKYTQFTGARSLIQNYIPVMTPMVSDGDTFDGVNGYEEWIICDAAKKARRKEESDTSDLERDMADVRKEIEDSAPNRDAGHAPRMVDAHSVDPFDYIRIPSRIRYKMLGQNIQFVQSFAYGSANG